MAINAIAIRMATERLVIAMTDERRSRPRVTSRLDAPTCANVPGRTSPLWKCRSRALGDMGDISQTG